MPQIALPSPYYGKDDKETIKILMDTVAKLRKELEYALYNLDDTNVTGSLTLGRNAYIKWEELGQKPTPEEMGAKPYMWSPGITDVTGLTDRLTYIDGYGIYTGILTAEQVNAIQGIVLGSNASIRWAELEEKPTPEEMGAKPYAWNPAWGDISGLKPAQNADNTYDTIGTDRLTHIDAFGIYTGTLTAQQINAIQGITLGVNAVIQWADLPDLPSATQIGARPSNWTPTAAEVGARPASWTPTADEVGARSNTWLPTPGMIGALPTGTFIPDDGHITTISRNAITTTFVNALDITAKYVTSGDFTAFNSIQLGGYNSINKVLRMRTQSNTDIVLKAWTDIGPGLSIGYLLATDADSVAPKQLDFLELNAERIDMKSATIDMTGSNIVGLTVYAKFK